MFIYYTQVIIIKFYFQILLNSSKESILQLIKNFIKAYFTNNKATGLIEILNNRLLIIKINKKSFGTFFVLISFLKENIISYKKLIISINNLSLLFNELVLTIINFLKEKLLFSLYNIEYNSLLLKDFNQVKNNWNSIPFKCFKDFYFNTSNNDLILFNIIISNKRLLREFFSFKNSKLIIKQKKIKEYFEDLIKFLKLYSVLIYFTSGLPL